MCERLSAKDESLLYGYAIHIQRYEFAAQWCTGRVVLDAGCGTGYGSWQLIRRGCREVTAVDVSPEAIEEARDRYRSEHLRFLCGDLENMASIIGLPERAEVIVNLENIEHLHRPKEFLAGARSRLARPDGVLITSTPNGLLTEYDEHGRNVNPFHVKEFTREEFLELLAPFFGKIELFGQWETTDGRLRQAEDKRLFEQICEAYYNPAARLGRMLRRAFSRRVTQPPEFRAAGASYSWEYGIHPLDDQPFPWEPVVLVAVCSG